MILVPLPRFVFPTQPPLFSPGRRCRRRMLLRDRASLDLGDPSRVPPDDSTHRAALDPPREATVARCVRRISSGHVLPRRAGAHHPEHAVEHVAVRLPWAPAIVGSHRKFGKKWFEYCALFVGEVHRLVQTAADRGWKEAPEDGASSISYACGAFVEPALV